MAPLASSQDDHIAAGPMPTTSRVRPFGYFGPIMLKNIVDNREPSRIIRITRFFEQKSLISCSLHARFRDYLGVTKRMGTLSMYIEHPSELRDC